MDIKPELTIDIVRHGQTEYVGVGQDLTPEGVRQIEQVGHTIASSINPEADFIRIWASPAARTRFTEQIIRDILEQKGIVIPKETNFPLSMIDKRKSTARMIQTYEGKDLSAEELEQRLSGRVLELANLSEPIEEVYARFNRMMEYAIREGELIAKQTGKFPRHIWLGHNAPMADILIQAGLISKPEEVPFAAHAHIQVMLDHSNDRLKKLLVSMNGNTGNIQFDRDQRAFTK